MITINNAIDFDLQFTSTFGNLDKTTLSNIKKNRIRLELGGSKGNAQKAISRSNSVMKYCFDKKEIWLRVILWGEFEENNLKNAGFETRNATIHFKCKQDDREVLFVKFEHFSNELAEPFITTIINNDLAIEPSANITCYFIDFNSKLIINIYDDRGLDIYSPLSNTLTAYKDRFNDWLI